MDEPTKATMMPKGLPMQRQSLAQIMAALAVEDGQHPALLQYANLRQAARERAADLSSIARRMPEALTRFTDLSDPETW